MKKLLDIMLFTIVLSVLLNHQLFSQFNYKSNWEFPIPDGIYKVGTSVLHFTDSSREEIITKAPDDFREVLVRAWYPAEESTTEERLKYLEGYSENLGELWQKFGIPDTVLKELQKRETYSYKNASVIQNRGPFPVVLFSPGYALPVVELFSSMLENLASQGYIVFAVSHPYEIAEVVYPNGKIINLDSTRFRRMLREGKPEWAFTDTITNPEMKRELEIETVRESFSLNSSLNLWIGDLRFLIDKLYEINSSKASSLFSGKMALDKIGVLGHSFGGAAAGQLCLVDTRVSAGINLDGTQFGDILDNDLSKPFMMVYSEEGKGMNDIYFEKSSGPIYYLTIKNSAHTSFGNGFYWETDKLNYSSFNKSVNTYITAFFDQYLKGKKSILPHDNLKNDELEFIIKSNK